MIKNLNLLVLLIFTIININSQNKIEYISPLPGSKYITPQNNIVIGFDNPITYTGSELNNSLIITGSETGKHEGEIIITGDNKKIIFKPFAFFKTGETITVKFSGKLSKEINTVTKNNTYSFTIYDKKLPWKSVYGLEKERHDSYNNILDPPFLNVTVNNNPYPGYIFSTPWFINTHLLISKVNGSSHWFRELPQHNADFKKQPNGYLSYFSDAEEKFIALNPNYDIDKSYACGNGYSTDLHEFRLLSNGHALLMAYDPQEVDMSQIVPGGHPRASVTGLIIQEIDNDTNVVFQWRSWDHFQITDAVHEILTDSVIDYVHGNAIELDNDGNLMICSRHLDEITKINRTTGNIIWRLGGKNNQFTFINDTTKFCYQHAIRRIPNGNITLYDNGNYRWPQYSRAVEYRLDEVNKTAELVWQYRNTPAVFGNWGGYVQRLANGNTFISWGGTSKTMTEVTQGGIKVFEASFQSGYYSYRAYKFDWNGGTVSINNNSGAIVKEFTLFQNYPNPFNPVTNIEFSVPHASFVNLTIYEASGREVIVLVNQNLQQGKYKMNFDGSTLNSGVYFSRIIAGGYSESKKMILIK